MFEREGFTLEKVSGINAFAANPSVKRRLWRLYRLANALFLSKFDDMKFQQFAVVAKLGSPREKLQSLFA